MHTLFLFAPPIVVLVLVMNMQYTYASLLSPDA